MVPNSWSHSQDNVLVCVYGVEGDMLYKYIKHKLPSCIRQKLDCQEASHSVHEKVSTGLHFANDCSVHIV